MGLQILENLEMVLGLLGMHRTEDVFLVGVEAAPCRFIGAIDTVQVVKVYGLGPHPPHGDHILATALGHGIAADTPAFLKLAR